MQMDKDKDDEQEQEQKEEEQNEQEKMEQKQKQPEQESQAKRLFWRYSCVYSEGSGRRTGGVADYFRRNLSPRYIKRKLPLDYLSRHLAKGCQKLRPVKLGSSRRTPPTQWKLCRTVCVCVGVGKRIQFQFQFLSMVLCL